MTAGATAYSAVLTLENELATLEASLPALEQKRVQAEDLLATLAGVFPDEWHADQLSLFDITLPSKLPAVVPSELVRRRPDILQAEAALHVASANINLVADGQYHQAQIAYIEDVAQRLQDTVALYVALGGGWNQAQ